MGTGFSEDVVDSYTYYRYWAGVCQGLAYGGSQATDDVVLIHGDNQARLFGGLTIYSNALAVFTAPPASSA